MVQTDTRIYNAYEHIYSDFFIDRSYKSGVAACHLHNTGEFLLAESGNSTSSASGEVCKLGAPYLIYYPPYVPHTQSNDSSVPYSRYCMSIDPEYLDGMASELPQSFFAFELNRDEFLRLNDIVSILYKHYSGTLHASSETSLTRRKYLLLLFLNELTPMIAARRPELLRARYRYINEVCGYISTKISEKLPLSELADKFFVSRTKLIQDFRAAKGISVCDYITAVRISKSKMLLRDGLSLADIAHECGFSSSAYFIRVFEKSNNITPAKFKESHDEYLFFDNEENITENRFTKEG